MLPDHIGINFLNFNIHKMKKIILGMTAMLIMSSFAAFADNGKKPSGKKKAKVANCAKTKCCNTNKCDKTACPDFPGCICH